MQYFRNCLARRGNLMQNFTLAGQAVSNNLRKSDKISQNTDRISLILVPSRLLFALNNFVFHKQGQIRPLKQPFWPFLKLWFYGFIYQHGWWCPDLNLANEMIPCILQTLILTFLNIYWNIEIFIFHTPLVLPMLWTPRLNTCVTYRIFSNCEAAFIFFISAFTPPL